MALVGFEGHAATWLETVRRLDSCLSHQFGYFLGHLKPKKASGKAIWLSFGFMEVFIKLYPTLHHPTLLPYMEVFVILTVPVL